MTPDLDTFISHSLLILLPRLAGPDAYGAACVSLARQLLTNGREPDFAAWMDSSPAERAAILRSPAPDRERDPGAWDALERYKNICRTVGARIAAEEALR